MDYQVMKGKYIMVKGKCITCQDDIPENAIIDQTWIDQRVVILKKSIKEQKKTDKKEQKWENKS